MGNTYPKCAHGGKLRIHVNPRNFHPSFKRICDECARREGFTEIYYQRPDISPAMGGWPISGKVINRTR